MNVRETVHNALLIHGLSSYERQAEPVVAALEEREREIASSLIAFATGKGLSRTEAERAISEAGLSVPTPEATTVAEGDLASEVSSLKSTVERLVGFAQRHGYR